MSTLTAALTTRRITLGSRLLKEYAIVWVTLLLFVFLATTTTNFLSVANFRNVLDQQSTVLIVAALATLTIIAGGFDVSLSAIYILSPLVALRVENATGSVLLAIAAGIATGIAAGTINATAVTVFKINSFIATLATSFAFFGLAYYVSSKSILRPSSLGYRHWVSTRIFGLTSATWMAAIVVVLAWFLLDRTRFGRYVFASGGNPEAGRLAGVRVSAVLAVTFALGGAAAGFAGTIVSAQTLSAQATDDFSFIFAVIAAIVVGGTSIAGGEGAVWRTVVGVFFIAMLINGFNLNGVDPVYQRIIEGVVILLAVGTDAWTRSRRT
jgi:ribose transport system permease protein